MNLKSLKNKRYAKGFLALLGAILLGALGSGLWELVLKGLMNSSRDVLLNLVSFGLHSIKDITYSQIARGFHEEASMNLLLFTVTIIILLGLFLSLFGIVSLRILIRKQEAILLELDSLKQVEDQSKQPTKVKSQVPNSSVDDIRKLVNRLSFKRLKVPAYILYVIVVLTFSATIADYVRFSYVNSAITHFQQVFTIAAPFMDDPQRREVMSSYAQIRNREDYVLIVQRLESIATQNGQRIPAFSAW
jgi:hypothetical protein